MQTFSLQSREKSAMLQSGSSLHLLNIASVSENNDAPANKKYIKKINYLSTSNAIGLEKFKYIWFT